MTPRQVRRPGAIRLLRACLAITAMFLASCRSTPRPPDLNDLVVPAAVTPSPGVDEVAFTGQAGAGQPAKPRQGAGAVEASRVVQPRQVQAGDRAVDPAIPRAAETAPAAPPGAATVPPLLARSSGWSVPGFGPDVSREDKFFRLNAVSTAVTLFYGFAFWDYGKDGYHLKQEKWFSESTAYGGADKLGHMYSAFVASDIFSSIYADWGYDPDEAILRGALSSEAMFALIEVGDGASKHGFSPEDLVMDTVGVAFSYARQHCPALDDLLDYRVQYVPSEAVRKGGKNDLVSDYSGFKYLLALKLSGFEACRDSWAQYLELHAGYYTRGYVSQDADYIDEKERVPYVGIGLNLSRLFDQQGFHRTGTLLRYYQLPGTYLPAEQNLND